MSFDDYIRYIKNISIEKYNEMSLEEKMYIEIEYDIAYGFSM